MLVRAKRPAWRSVSGSFGPEEARRLNEMEEYLNLNNLYNEKGKFCTTNFRAQRSRRSAAKLLNKYLKR